MATKAPQSRESAATLAKPPASVAAEATGLVKQVNFILRPNAIVAEGGAKVIFVCG